MGDPGSLGEYYLPLIGTATEENDRLTAQMWRVLEHSPIGAAIVDLDGKLRRANNAMARIAGTSTRELLGRNLDELPAPITSDAAGSAMDDPVEKTYVRPDGSTVPVSEHRSLVTDAEGNASFVVLQVQDLTERKAADTAREFLALTSHEMRSPLTSILGFAQTLRDSTAGMSPEETEAALAAIERQARRLNGVVSDLLARASRQMG